MLSPEFVPVFIALLATLCAVGVVVALFYSRVARNSESYKRYAAIAAIDTATDRRMTSEDLKRKKAIDVTLRELEEKQKIRSGAKPTLNSRMRQAGLSWNKNTYYIVCIGAGAAMFLIAITFFGIGPLPALGFGTSAGLLLPHLYVNVRRSRRFRKFSDEFPNAVDVIVRGVKAGLPLVDCLRIISLEAQEPVRGEFKIIVEDQAMGLPLDQSVLRLPERIPLAEANFFAIVVAMQSRTGGSLSEALANLSKVLRDRKKMKSKIKAVSSEAKASAGIIGCLPVVVASLIYLTAPAYISILFTTLAGQIVLVASALWMGIGILVMRKMINFDF